MIYGIAADKVVSSGGMPAEQVKFKALGRYLCTLAVTPDGELLPRQCERCISQCAYGRRLIEEINKRGAANEKQPKERIR